MKALLRLTASNYSTIAIACSLAALSTPLTSCAAAAAGMPQAVSGALPSPTYPAGSLQLALFQQLNQARNQCGFPALQENTILDQAAEAHQKYQVANSSGADTEVAGKSDFTGVTALARVEHFGFSSNAVGGGGSSEETVLASDADVVAQEALDFNLLADVYSATNLFTPVNLVGVGANSSVEAGQTAFVTMDVFNTATQPIASSPITFPCANSTNVAVTNSQSLNIPDGGGDIATVGPEILVMGNSSDRIVLTSGTMSSSTGGSFTLTLLDSANDPNKLLQPFQSVAYVSANDLNNVQSSTAYAVSIKGTVNGTAFTRSFTMTTENDLATGDPFPTPNPQPNPTPTPTPAPSTIKGDLPVDIPGRAPIHGVTPIAHLGTPTTPTPTPTPKPTPNPTPNPAPSTIKGDLPVDIPGKAPIHGVTPVAHLGAPSTPTPKPAPGTIKGDLPVTIPGRAPIHGVTPVAHLGEPSKHHQKPTPTPTHDRGTIKGDLPVTIPGRAPIHGVTPVARLGEPSKYHQKPIPTPTHDRGTIKGDLPVNIPGRAPIHGVTPVARLGEPSKYHPTPTHDRGTSKGDLPVDIPGSAPIHATTPVAVAQR